MTAIRAALIPLLLAAAAMAQDQGDKPPAKNASISGVVRDRVTGQPLADFSVSTYVNATWSGNSIQMGASTRPVQSMTDQQGRYRLSDLPPGEYRISARAAQRFGSMSERTVMLAGQDLENIDFRIAVDGIITGKVVDENKEPLPGVTVFLVEREYFLGSLGSFLRSAGRTDDRGVYRIERVQAGHQYLLLAEKRDLRLPAISEAPLNPKLRRPVPMRTWYPNSPAADGASPVSLQPGERREGVDIEMKKSASYCVEGTLIASGGPGPIGFSIEAQHPSSGVSNSGGMFSASPGGTTGPDGKFRICDLYPGVYRLSAIQWNNDPNQAPPYGVMEVTISDRDIRGVRLSASPGMPLEGEVVWDGAAPEKADTTTPDAPKLTLSLYFQPLLRASFRGDNNSARPEIPGPFSLPRMLVDDYQLRASVNSPGMYVKDVTYGGRSVLYEPLRLGSAIGGTGLRVIVARDGGRISAQVKDKDGNPMSDLRVVFVPADVASEAILSARLTSCQTNQVGSCRSITLPPGRYFVGASDSAVDHSPAVIERLWRSRNRFKEVELAPGGSAQVTLEPVSW
jgi:hypothetical protein